VLTVTAKFSLRIMTQSLKLLWLSLGGALLFQPAVLANELDPLEVQSEEQGSEELELAELEVTEEKESVLASILGPSILESSVSDSSVSDSSIFEPSVFDSHASDNHASDSHVSEQNSPTISLASSLMAPDFDERQADTVLMQAAIAPKSSAASTQPIYHSELQQPDIQQSGVPLQSDTLIAQAEEEDGNTAGIPGTFSGTVALTTNYVFRGLSQSDNNPAIQGSFDYALPLSEQVSVYAGVFGSSVDFNDGDEASIEVDLYTGVAYQPTEKLSTSFTAFYYLYPGASSSLNYDYFEFFADANYDLDKVVLGATAAYSPDNFASSGDAFYVEGRADVPLPQDLTLSAALGYQTISDNAAFGTPDHLNWSVGLGYSLAGFDLSLKYTDTDLSRGECFGGTDLCDAGAVFTVSRSF